MLRQQLQKPAYTQSFWPFRPKFVKFGGNVRQVWGMAVRQVWGESKKRALERDFFGVLALFVKFGAF
jgi:hypothetical protein